MWIFIYRLYILLIYGLMLFFAFYILCDLTILKRTSDQTYIYSIFFCSGISTGITIQRILFYLSKKSNEEEEKNTPIDHVPGNQVEDNDNNKLEGIPDQNEKVELPV